MDLFLVIHRKLYAFWKKLGPGLITGASDDDPSGIATYSQAGAMFGLSLLWTACLTYPLMYVIQEMCARIGIVCSTGLVGIIKNHYSKSLAYLLILFSFPAIILNIAADISGMSAVANLLVPQISISLFACLITLLTIYGLLFFSYNKIASILKNVCIVLGLYFIVPFLVEQDWKKVFINTFVPSLQFNKEYISMLVAILGTTISPYLFFWQTSMSVEQKNHEPSTSTGHQLTKMKTDVNTGMLLSNLAMYFIILTTGSVLYNSGVGKIDTVEEAALALKPLAGNWAYLFFSIGVLGVGALAIPVLAACIGYMLAETFNWKKGLDKKFNEAKEFYITIIASLLIGLVINIIGIDPIASLILTAIIYGLIAPPLIALIIHVSNNKKIMGNHTNSYIINILGFFTFFVMGGAAILLIIQFFI